MNKIIKNKSVKKAENGDNTVNTFCFRIGKDFPVFWEKYKLFIGYTVSCSLVILFLTLWTFNLLYFCLSLLWAFSYWSRLRYAVVMIEKQSVITLWSIFCFGFLGIIMQLFSYKEFSIVSVVIAGIIAIVLYCLIPIISYHLKYNDETEGWIFGEKSKFNGATGSLFLLVLTMAIAFCSDIDVQQVKEEQLLSSKFAQEIFVPVKVVDKESYNGTTYYILEAKGQRFYVSPFEYPEVRNITDKTQVKVIFDDINQTYQLMGVKKIQFKN